MRILQVLPALVSGGVERGTVEIASALQAEGHHAWVVSGGGPLVADVESVGAMHHRLPLTSKNPWVMGKNALALALAQPLLVMPLMTLLHIQPGFALLWPALIVTWRRACQAQPVAQSAPILPEPTSARG